MALNLDSMLEIVKKVDTLGDLQKICSLNSRMSELCESNKRSIFLAVVKNDNFRKSFFNRFDQIINEHGPNQRKFDELLKWYPIGKLFSGEDTFINDMQTEFYNVFVSEGATRSKFAKAIGMYLRLLFMPSNYVLNRIEVEVLFDLLEIFHKSSKFPLGKQYYHKLISFHFKKYKTMNKNKYRDNLNAFIKDIFITYALDPVYNQDFTKSLLKELYSFDKELVQKFVYKYMYAQLDPSDSVETEAFQDEHGINYELVRDVYNLLDIDSVRRKRVNG